MEKQNWDTLSVTSSSKTEEIAIGSEEEYITEHYWGYTKINENITSEYEVQHPRWQVYPVKAYRIEVDFANNYGEEFGFLSSSKPNSVMLAEGSEICVMKGKKYK